MTVLFKPEYSEKYQRQLRNLLNAITDCEYYNERHEAEIVALLRPDLIAGNEIGADNAGA